MVLRPLLDKAGIQPYAESFHPFFETPTFTSPQLDHLTKLYVSRVAPLWKEKSIDAWLHSNVIHVIQRVSQNDQDCLNAATVVQIKFADTQFSQLAISDYTDDISSLPRDIMQQAAAQQQAFDPVAAHTPIIHAPSDNLLYNLLYSLLPWNPTPNAPPE